MRGLLLIGLIFWCSEIMQGQSLYYTEYDENQGLKNTHVNVVLQDPNGFLWIGTMDGLFKFDGSNFSEVFFNDLNTDKAVYDIAIDDKQEIWIAGKNGVTSFNGSNFKHFSLNNDLIDVDRFPRIAIMGGKKFYLTPSGSLFQIKDKKLENIRIFFGTTPEDIIDWHTTDGDLLWMLSENGNIYYFSDNSLRGPFNILGDKMKLLSFSDSREKTEGSFELITDQGVLEAKMDSSDKFFSHQWKFRSDRIRAYFTDSKDQQWLIQDNDFLRIDRKSVV